MNKITISPKIKINNPCDKSDLLKYEGPIEKFEDFAGFEKQRENYEKLQNTLSPLNIKLSYMWVGIFSSHGKRLHFVAKDPTNTVFWVKYEAESRGSGQNKLYINEQQIKLTTWLAMTPSEQIIFFSNKNK